MAPAYADVAGMHHLLEIGTMPSSPRSSREDDAGRPDNNGAAPSSCFEDLLHDVASGGLSATRRSFKKGEVVFHEGDVADGLHVISSGRFAVRCEMPSGASVILAILGRPDVFGEFGLFSSDRSRTATVAAMTSAQTLMLPEPLVKEMIVMRPDFATA